MVSVSFVMPFFFVGLILANSFISKNFIQNIFLQANSCNRKFSQAGQKILPIVYTCDKWLLWKQTKNKQKNVSGKLNFIFNLDFFF